MFGDPSAADEEPATPAETPATPSDTPPPDPVPADQSNS